MSNDWLSDNSRASVHFIQKQGLLSEGRTWGFAVIRPTDAAADDEQWEAAVGRLREYVGLHFCNDDKLLHQERLQRGEHDDSPLDPTPTELLVCKLELPVLDVHLEPGQSARHEPTEPRTPLLESARARFRHFVSLRDYEEDEDARKLGTIRLDACLVLDAAAMEKLTDPNVAPDDAHVIVLDIRDDLIERDFYGAWMWAQPTSLSSLYSDLRCMSIIECCPLPKFRGQLPLYNGWNRENLIDPHGGCGLALGGTTRGRGGGI